MNKGKVYISGPMTGHKDQNKAVFAKAEKFLIEHGFEVINPHKISQDDPYDWQKCMRADIAELLRCKYIAMLPGWESSKGALVEYTLAQGLAMQILYLNFKIGMVNE